MFTYAYELFHLVLYFVWISSAESHLSLIDSVVCSAERLCEGKLFRLGQRKRVSALRVLYESYHIADHLLHEYLHHLVVARNSRVAAALDELAVVISRCRTDQFNRSFLPAAICL